MTNASHGLLAVLILGCLPLGQETGWALEVARTVCEYAAEPLGVTVEQPRLGWTSVNPVVSDRGQRQTAYQILVASSAGLLALDKGDLWDSGKVATDQSIDVPYQGQTLRTGQACFWKVRVWDRDGGSSPWSRAASWSMGVLDPAAWRAQWIGVGDPSVRWTDYTVEASFLLRKEATSIYFRAQGAGNAYLWQINHSGPVPTFRPHVRVNGDFRVLKDLPLDRWLKKDDLGSPHRLTIRALGSEITTLLDGQVIDVTTDSQHAAGGVGFRASPTEEAVFQTIRVTDPAGHPLLTENFTRERVSEFRGGKLGSEGLVVSHGDVMPEGSLRTPRLRREFALDKPVARAWVYASALGIYEMRLNGEKVGDRFFAPGWTNYRKRIEYQTYDVTRQLRRGTNAIAAQLAPGWYAGNIGWFGPNQYGSEPRLFAELHVEYADGRTEVIVSDGAWKASAGPVVSADYLDGEVYDARLEQTGWDQAGFDDHAWQGVDTGVAEETTRLVAQVDPPIRVTREWKPLELTEPQPGVYVYRLPQNITGVARLKIMGAPGTTVTVRHAEALNRDGTLNLSTLNSPGIGNARAHNVDTYTFGQKNSATFQPGFTWRGFQYVEVSGTAAKPTLEDVAGLSIGTDVPSIGELHTSSELINRINQNLHWSGRDAFMSFPMDCPQRSERLGWAGDANFYLATAAFNFDLARFYTKWERDLIDSQSPNGLMCHVAPGGWAGSASEGGYGGGWGDVAVCVPYQLWRTYGDLGIVRESYPAMARWVECLQRVSTGLILPAGMAAAADWQNQGDPTRNELCATAYFAYDVRLLSEMADALGKTEDAAKYDRLFDDLRAAFTKNFVAPDGTVGTGSQTGYVLALHVGLLPDDLRAAAAAKLVENVTRHGNQLTTGFVGTQWLLPVLTNIGRPDLAYAVLEQRSKPSWGYMVDHGATTIWENWNVINPDGTINSGPNSLNHCALGSCGDWLYENIGGIQRDPSATAFRRVIIHPQPGGGLTEADASYDSPYGPITTQWQLNHGDFTLKVAIPVGTTAKVFVPAAIASVVSEGDGSAAAASGVRLLTREHGAAGYVVGSGVYVFRSEMP